MLEFKKKHKINDTEEDERSMSTDSEEQRLEKEKEET